MIFTRCKILKIPNEGDQYYTISIPLFSDTTLQDITFENVVECHTPGYYGGYKVGDTAFVTFESDDAGELTMPVIIGKLFTGDIDKDTSGLLVANQLYVSNKATLPKNTNVANEINYTLDTLSTTPTTGGVISIDGVDGKIVLDSENMVIDHTTKKLRGLLYFEELGEW